MKRRSSSTTGVSTTTASPNQRVVVPTNATQNDISLKLSLNNHQDSNNRSKKYVLAPPFLPCHMRMLKSLYKKEDPVSCKKHNCDGTAASSSPKQRDKCDDDDETEIWSLIQSFLEQRGHIRRTNSESDKMRGVLAEASSYTQDCQHQTRNDPNNPRHSEYQTLSNERHHKAVGNHNSHRKKQKRTHVSSQQYTTTMLSSFTQQQSPLQSSSYGANMMGGGFTQSSSSGMMNHHHRQDRIRLQQTTEIFADGFDSWSVLTKILGRKSAASAQKANLAARPLLPLMEAVNQRLNALRIELRDMKNARAHRNHSIRILGAGVTTTNHTSSGQDNTTAVLPENVEGYDQEEEEEEEAIAITSNKIHLWGRLANDLKATIGI